MSQFNHEPIAELEPQTKAKLRSTQLITSLPQLISELVQNSLDADASHVEVGINPTEWECWVRDNGRGMSAEGMGLLTQGHEKGRYVSSKTYEASRAEAGTFGFRGEALASAMELSCLEISSRTSSLRESWSVILKGGEQLYLGPSIRWRRERAGTTVICRDVFFNVPVRRKSHPNVMRTLDLTRKELETLALVFPQVAFTLDHTNESQKTRVLSISKTSSSLATFRALYGKSMAESVEELNIRSEDLTIEGFISRNGSQSRGYQNFYVNRHPMIFGDIQRAIEQKFAASGFGRLAWDGSERISHLASPILYPIKKVDRKPVYVLNLSVSPTQIDNFLEPAKSMIQFQDVNRVLSFVLEVIHRFLSRNGFATVLPKPTEAEAAYIERARPPHKRVRYDKLGSNSSNVQGALLNLETYRGLACSDAKLPQSCSNHHIGAKDTLIQRDDSGYFGWAGPPTGESLSIDSQTGNSLPKHRILDQTQADRSASINGSPRGLPTPSLGHCSLERASSDALGAHSVTAAFPTWLAKVMKRDGTFTSPEPSIFTTRPTSSSSGLDHHGPGSRAHIRTSLEMNRVSTLAQSSQLTSQSFSRTDLQNSKVIAQIDTKFLACILRVKATSERILVLVDQHAADERVRVERYLKRLCTGFIQNAVVESQLEPPVKILLSNREASILERPDTLGALSRWGLRIKINVPDIPGGQSPTEESEFYQADVISVPDVVSKKLADKREVSGFVKAMVATIDVEGCAHWPPPSTNVEDNDWVKVLRLCPTPLFELVNSRACRGAIMFNDPLDQRQCQSLIMQLGETVFPFQCAHGRPSIAPLLRVDTSHSTTPAIDWEAFNQEF